VVVAKQLNNNRKEEGRLMSEIDEKSKLVLQKLLLRIKKSELMTEWQIEDTRVNSNRLRRRYSVKMRRIWKKLKGISKSIIDITNKYEELEGDNKNLYDSHFDELDYQDEVEYDEDGNRLTHLDDEDESKTKR